LLTQSHFNKSLPTKIYSHGLNGFPSEQGWGLRDGKITLLDAVCKWKLRREIVGYLQLEDCNFIAVDWSLLAAGDFTVVATVGVPIAGTFTGSFVDFLIDQGAVMESFHLIGFSMGAHVVGIAGSTVTKGKLPRITGG
jgi:Lipase